MHTLHMHNGNSSNDRSSSKNTVRNETKRTKDVNKLNTSDCCWLSSCAISDALPFLSVVVSLSLPDAAVCVCHCARRMDLLDEYGLDALSAMHIYIGDRNISIAINYCVFPRTEWRIWCVENAENCSMPFDGKGNASQKQLLRLWKWHSSSKDTRHFIVFCSKFEFPSQWPISNLRCLTVFVCVFTYSSIRRTIVCVCVCVCLTVNWVVKIF